MHNVLNIIKNVHLTKLSGKLHRLLPIIFTEERVFFYRNAFKIEMERDWQLWVYSPGQ